MLNKFIQKMKDEVNARYDEQLLFASNPAQMLTNKLDTLIEIKEDLQNQLNSKSSGLFFNRLFSTKAQKEQQKTELLSNLQQTEKDIEKTKQELDELQIQVEDINKQREYALAVLKDKQRIIKYLIEEDNSLVSNPDFMSEAIEVSLENIKFDQSLNADVYKKFLKLYSEKMETSGFFQVKVGEIIDELDNPKQCDDSKYKIPHKFLFEAIRLKAEEIFSAGEMQYASHDDLLQWFDIYRQFDGILPIKNGKLLEKLYCDSLNYLYMHKIQYQHTHLNESEINNIAQSICQEGLKIPHARENGKIDYTTMNSYSDRSQGIFAFLEYWSNENGIVVLQIPKKHIDENRPIIGCERNETLSAVNLGYVLPKYVVGAIVNGKFRENPYEPTERKKYKYLVCDKGSEIKSLEKE